MSHQGDRAAVKRSLFQFIKFGLVGASNTILDFGITNVLFLIFQVTTGFGLTMISVTACMAATLNSWFLNKKWTFKGGDGSFRKFFGVAMIGLVVNTSVFLFVARLMTTRMSVDPMLAINAAKLCGVAAALIVSFLGYRFGVFQTEGLAKFREEFRFDATPRGGVVTQVVVLMVAALVVRLGYLTLTSVVFGDGVSYAWVATSLASGAYDQVDSFWSSLFCYWQALFHWSGLSPHGAAVASSLVPGVLLMWPVTWLARTLFGTPTAWLAGAFCVVHPRFVEYSCNGYAETFYLLGFTAGTAGAVQLIRTGSWKAAVLWGTGLGVMFTVRGEGIVAFAFQASFVGIAEWRRRAEAADEEAVASPGVRPMALGAAVMAFLGVSLCYAGLSQSTLGTPGIMQKASNLSKQFSEQLDMREAARETYGADGALFGDREEAPAPSFGEKALILIKRYPRNVMYSLERMPGVLLSPVILFVFMLPVFSRRRHGRGQGEIALASLLLFPVAFYPTIQVEPRLFMAMLVPIHVFGAAGIVAFVRYVEDRAPMPLLKPGIVAGVLVLTSAVTVWRGIDLENQHEVHRELASWIDENVPSDDLIVGCGYGWVSTTGFVTGHRTTPRVWTDDASTLAESVREKGAEWLIIYQGYLEQANPELMDILDAPPAGFKKAHEVATRSGKRAVIYRLETNS